MRADVPLPIGAGLRFSEQGLRWVLSAYALTFGGALVYREHLSAPYLARTAIAVAAFPLGAVVEFDAIAS